MLSDRLCDELTHGQRPELPAIERDANEHLQDVDVAYPCGPAWRHHALAELWYELSLGSVKGFFVDETTQKTSAHARNSLRVQCQTLVLCHLDGHRRKVRQERIATELQPARANAANHLGRVARANLTKLDALARYLPQSAKHFAVVNLAVA
jgi:hypothetical protein